jgi:hypothetical protein
VLRDVCEHSARRPPDCHALVSVKVIDKVVEQPRQTAMQQADEAAKESDASLEMRPRNENLQHATNVREDSRISHNGLHQTGENIRRSNFGKAVILK